MPRKITLNKEIKHLEQARRDLKTKIKALANVQRCLLLRHSLLHAWCESLSLMQGMRLSSTVKVAAQECEVYTKLVHREVSLLQQLAVAGTGEAFSDVADVLNPGISTVAPTGDPMAYFRQHVLRTPLPEAATMTAKQLAKDVREATLQASVLLHSMEGLEPHEQAPIVAQMQEIWNRCTHAAMSLISAGREDILETMNIINLDTLQPDVEGSFQVGAQTARIVSRLQLTDGQQRIMAAGTGVYMQLLDSIRQERQQLQLQFAEPPGTLPAHGSTDSNSLRAARNCGGQAVQHDADSLSRRHAQLEAEQQRSARLQLLMQKE